MSRDIEPLLAPWMERQARGAPHDLLPRVMREVRSMSQESRAFGAGLLSFSMVAWLTGGIAVVATAIAAGVLIANLSGAPAGGQGSPSPTATPSSAAGTIRESDPVGDATGNAPDIVAVGISRVSEDLFMLDIELAEPMASGTELTVWLETNGAGPYPGPVPMEGPELCYSWFMEESVAVGPTGSVQNRAGGGKWLPSPVLNGTKVTLDIPLQEIGVTNRLAFQVVTGVDDEARDWFPDQADGCYPLIWESSPAAAPGSPSPVATPSSAAETMRQRDPAGDATGDAPDMVAVNTTIIPDDEVTLEIELADPQLCSPWFMEHGVQVGPVGIASYLSEVLHPGPTVVDGTTVTLAIPIRTVIWDGFLTLLVHTPGSGEGEPWADEVGQDRFPNDDNACFPVIVPAS